MKNQLVRFDVNSGAGDGDIVYLDPKAEVNTPAASGTNNTVMTVIKNLKTLNTGAYQKLTVTITVIGAGTADANTAKALAEATQIRQLFKDAQRRTRVGFNTIDKGSVKYNPVYSDTTVTFAIA